MDELCHSHSLPPVYHLCFWWSRSPVSPVLPCPSLSVCMCVCCGLWAPLSPPGLLIAVQPTWCRNMDTAFTICRPVGAVKIRSNEFWVTQTSLQNPLQLASVWTDFHQMCFVIKVRSYMYIYTHIFHFVLFYFCNHTFDLLFICDYILQMFCRIVLWCEGLWTVSLHLKCHTNKAFVVIIVYCEKLHITRTLHPLRTGVLLFP